MIHNGSNHDFKLLMKHIALHKKDIYSISENTEKYMTFSFPIVTSEIESDELDKDGNKQKKKTRKCLNSSMMIHIFTLDVKLVIKDQNKQ